MTSTNQELRSIRSQLSTLRKCCVALAGLTILAPLATFASMQGDDVQEVVRAERLEIVEGDGQLAFVMGNSKRPGAGYFEGQKMFSDGEERRQGGPSMIYYDSQGDEVGGMGFTTEEAEDGFHTIRQLSLDAYRQDQTVVLKHFQSEEGSISGMYINDRPTESLVDGLRALGFEPGASFRDVQKAMERTDANTQQVLEKYFGASQRVFIGSRYGEAKLELADGKGRPRFVISVPEEGPVSMRVLDEQGNEVQFSSVIQGDDKS